MARQQGKLTDQQELFVLELSKGKSQREAYKIAYPTCLKWKDNVIDIKACQLAANDKVAIRLSEIRNKYKKEAEDKAIIEVKDIIRFHADVLKSDIKDYLSFGMVEKIKYSDDYDREIIEKGIGIELKESNEVNGKLIKKVSLGANGTFNFELYDKNESAKELARIMGLYDDKTKMLFPDPIKVDVISSLSTDKLERLYDILKGEDEE